MSSPGSPQALLIPQSPCTVVIIKTAWNAAVTDKLEAGALDVLNKQNARSICLTVPGAVELTHAASMAIVHHQPDAVIVLGCIIKGDTPHFDYVCQSVTQGITQLNCNMQVPVIFGVLTVNTQLQADERTGGIHGNKGEESATTALHMIALAQKNYQP